MKPYKLFVNLKSRTEARAMIRATLPKDAEIEIVPYKVGNRAQEFAVKVWAAELPGFDIQ